MGSHHLVAISSADEAIRHLAKCLIRRQYRKKIAAYVAIAEYVKMRLTHYSDVFPSDGEFFMS